MSLIPKKGTVYVVDDDEAVRDSLQWLLEGKDYRVKCFDSAESFLSRFDPREVACLIADIRMDGMSGLELQDEAPCLGEGLGRERPQPLVQDLTRSQHEQLRRVLERELLRRVHRRHVA